MSVFRYSCFYTTYAQSILALTYPCGFFVTKKVKMLLQLRKEVFKPSLTTLYNHLMGAGAHQEGYCSHDKE